MYYNRSYKFKEREVVCMATKFRTFNICQYEKNPKSGEDLHFNENNIIECVSHKTIKLWAHVCHDKDVATKDDETQNGFKEGTLKPRHWHIVLKCDKAIEIDTIAKWLGIPSNFIDVPRGGKRAFLDCVQYLTHEDEKQQNLGKHRYKDDEVKSNFDFRGALDERDANIARYGEDLTPIQQVYHDVLYCGKTIKECMEDDKILYMEHFDKIAKYRLEYIKQQQPPQTRLNYYICGSGGVGKDLMSRALARSLYPQYENDDNIFFIVGAENATFEGYDGQPVIIWSDFRAYDLIETLGSRGNVFRVFDTHPHKQRQNVKYSSINLINSVNIVNSIQPHMEFLDGLSGEYMKNGTLQKSEENEKKQSYRRFPFVIRLFENDFSFLINKGFVYNDDFLQYEECTRIRGNMQRIAEVCGQNVELARKIERQAISKIVDKHNEILVQQLQYRSEEDILKEFELYGKLSLNLEHPPRLGKDYQIPFN